MDEKDIKIQKVLQTLKKEVIPPAHLLKSLLEREVTISKEARYEKANVSRIFGMNDWKNLIFRTSLALAALVIFIGGATELGFRSDKFLGEAVLVLEAEASSIEYDLDEESLSSDVETLEIELDMIDESLQNNS
ncbi:MAG TPA: hypothetical protein VJJ24_01610 [Candidatus Paceibacterota bacterium]